MRTTQILKKAGSLSPNAYHATTLLTDGVRFT